MWRKSLPGYSKNRAISFVYLFCFLVLLLCLFSACASSLNIYNKLSDTQYTSCEYRAVLKRWTRKGSIHRGLRTELLVTATYKEEQFRKAYTEEYARVYMLTSTQNASMMDDQMAAAEAYDDFLVSIYTQEKQWDDFSERDSLWKVYLIKDGQFRIVPLEIRKVKKSRTLSETFYPFISHWSSIYIFRFKKKDSPQPSQSVELVLTSAPGCATLRWNL
jgi:hypothetical protein